MNDNSKVIDVDVNEILPNRFQPRIQFNENEILELSDSIKEHGIIQPLVVRQIGDKYEIIAGERRYKASVLAGKDTVPVIVKNLSDKDSAEIALIENVQRKNLTPLEEALSYKKILDMGYTTQELLAIKLGKSQSAIANKVRLLNLSDEVQEALLGNKISERHARSLLRLKTHTEQTEMLNKIINERLTVRKTDEEINRRLNNEGKGEDNMNNDSLFNQGFAPVAPATPVAPEVPSFDMGMPSVPAVEEPIIQPIAPAPEAAPVIEPLPAVEPIAPVAEPAPEVPSFDIFGPTPEVPEAPAVQPIEPIAAVEPIVPKIEPIAPVAEPAPMPTVEPITPVTEPAPEAPAMPSFDVFANMNAQNAEPAPEAPITSPIMDSNPTEVVQQNENTFDFGPMPTVEPIASVTEPAPEAPAIPAMNQPIEPIIVTDYTKQYDPVMPQVVEAPKIDFKEVINAIRECSSKIEQYGFKIDVEEYDLENLYQAVFKIEK